MNIPIGYIAFLLALCAVCTQRTAADNRPAEIFPSATTPVYVENRGQWNASALFFTRTPGLDVWLTREGVVYDMYHYEAVSGDPEKHRIGAVVKMEFRGAFPSSTAQGIARQEGYYSYIKGSSCTADVGSFSQAKLQDVYPNIDALFYCEGQTSRYDFIVRPGGDYRKIALVFQGAQDVKITESGNLLVSTGKGILVQRGLAAYQIIDGQRRSVACSFVLTTIDTEKIVSFSLGKYDGAHPLIIDPLVSGSFIGGSEKEEIEDVAVDAGGNMYILGTTVSSEFPLVVGQYDALTQNTDLFLTKFDYTGTRILFSTFIGGSGREQARGLARDDFGSLYITGTTSSSDMPAVSYSYPDVMPSGQNVFVACITSDGNSLRYFTVLGGSYEDAAEDIVVDKKENVYITGTTHSVDFPLFESSETYQGDGDVFLVSLDKKGERRFATLLAGTKSDSGATIAIDRNSDIWVAGHTTSKDLPATDLSTHNGADYNVFFAKWNSDGVRKAVGYIGTGAGRVTAMAVDRENAVYITGYTPDGSFTLPDSRIQPSYDKSYSGKSDGFIVKLTTNGKPDYSTFIGAAYEDIPRGITVDADGNVIVVGSTTQSGVVEDFLPTAFFPRYSLREGFVAVLRPGDQEFSYATYLGGSNNDECIAVTTFQDSTLVVVGNTLSHDFPVSLGAREYGGDQEGFIVRLQYMAKLDILPASLVVDFGKVYIGTTAKEDITLRNRGATFAEVTSLQLKHAQVFTTQQQAPLLLPSGDIPLELSFTPTKKGIATDSLTLTAKYLRKVFTIVLKGEGIDMPPPIVRVLPSTLDFGDMYIASVATLSVIVTNAGVVPAVVTSLTLSSTDNFTISERSFTLQPTESRQVFVHCSPSVSGRIQATLQVETARATSAEQVVLLVTGIPVPTPVLSVPAFFDFQKVQIGSAKEWTPSIMNTGTTSATLSLDAFPPSSFEASLSQSVVEPSASVNLTVRFAPTTTGVVSQNLTLRAQEQVESMTTAVVGEGVLPYAQVTTAELDFGRVRINEQVVLSTPIYNRGIDTLRLTAVASTHAFFQPDAIAVPFPIAVQEDFQLPITFAPTQIGTFASIVWVHVAYLPEPLPIRVTGMGIPADVVPAGIGVRPALLSMGDRAVGSTTASSFEVYNRSTTHSVQVTGMGLARDNAAFSLQLSQPVEFVLEKGEHRVIDVQFSPTEIGFTSAVVRVQSTVNTVFVDVQGWGTSGTLPAVDTVDIVVPSIRARIGEYVSLPLTFGNPEKDYGIVSQKGITGFRAVLHWNATLAQQAEKRLDETMVAGERYVEIEAPLPSSAHELYALPIRVLWGNAERTDITVSSFQWLPTSGENLYTRTTTKGEIVVTDIWHDKDGPRLINSLKGIIDVDISPNPFSDKTKIAIKTAAADATVKIYDALGTMVLDLTSRVSKEHTVELLSSELARGIYYCRVGTGAYALVRLLVVQ